MKHLRLFENFDRSDIYYHGTKKEFEKFEVGQDVATPTYGT